MFVKPLMRLGLINTHKIGSLSTTLKHTPNFEPFPSRNDRTTNIMTNNKEKREEYHLFHIWHIYYDLKSWIHEFKRITVDEDARIFMTRLSILWIFLQNSPTHTFLKKYIKHLFTNTSTKSFASTTNHVIHCLLDQPTDWLGWDILDCQSKDLDWIYYRVLMLPPLLFPCWSDDLFQYLPDVLSPNCVIMFSYQLSCD